MNSIKEKEFSNGRYYILVEEEEQGQLCCAGCCFVDKDNISCLKPESHDNLSCGNPVNGIYKLLPLEKGFKKKLWINNQ